MADLFDIVVARKLSGGGGGGSSDFSTATLTIINNTSVDPYIDIDGCIKTSMNDGVTQVITEEPTHLTPLGTDTFDLVLYKDKTIMWSEELSNFTVSLTGGITDEGEGVYKITGDCTITIS